MRHLCCRRLGGPGLRSAVFLLVTTLATQACQLGYLNPNFLLPGEARQRVRESATRYNNFLRFGNLEMASAWVRPDMRRPFLEVFAETARYPIRFTDVEIQSVMLGPGVGKARVVLLARLYRLPSVEQISIADEQTWSYDPGSLQWYIAPDLERYSAIGQKRAPRGLDPLGSADPLGPLPPAASASPDPVGPFGELDRSYEPDAFGNPVP